MRNIEKKFSNELFDFYKGNIELLRNVKHSKNKDNITHQCIIPYSTYSPWVDDTDFLSIYEKIKHNTLVDIYRCYELWSLVKRTSPLNGAILEVGTWRGGTGAILAAADKNNPDSSVLLADTFEGVVKASNKDSIYKGGEHSDTSEYFVNDLMQILGLKNYKILKGIFPDTVNLDFYKGPGLKICHIDVDTYLSAKDIFEYVWPKVVKGGVVIFDDYGFWGCEGVTNLCNEININNAIFIHNLNGHGLFVKI